MQQQQPQQHPPFWQQPLINPKPTPDPPRRQWNFPQPTIPDAAREFAIPQAIWLEPHESWNLMYYATSNKVWNNPTPQTGTH
jgi:hypothetical protein